MTKQQKFSYLNKPIKFNESVTLFSAACCMLSFAFSTFTSAVATLLSIRSAMFEQV